MRITINGETQQIAGDDLTIARLLEIKEVESPDMVSVQLNGEIIDRAKYSETRLADNDEIEFLYFMGGGTCR